MNSKSTREATGGILFKKWEQFFNYKRKSKQALK